MKPSKIELSPHVVRFLRQLAPEPRRQLHVALRALARNRGDILELEHPLDGFHRLRVGRYRVIFHYVVVGKERVIRCDYAERRELVYELFTDLIEGA
jgi:mRNA-degrading endonuclease RelE of RelBE toxin-antitoxin system